MYNGAKGGIGGVVRGKPLRANQGKLSNRDLSGVLVISYDVWISGTKLGLEKKQCIEKVDIKETVEGADSATIEIADPEMRFLDDNIFEEDSTVKIVLGWGGTTYRSTFEGYISAIDVNFNNDGIPRLTITCMDKTHIMNRQKKDRTFSNTTSAAVVKLICQEYGFKCETDTTYAFEVQETITQSNQSDIEFITKLAGDEVHPFTARLVGDTFYYEKMGKLKTPAMELTYVQYPHDVVSFSPKLNKETKQVEVKGASVDTSTKAVSSVKGKVDSGEGGASSEGNEKKKGYTYNPTSRSWSPPTTTANSNGGKSVWQEVATSLMTLQQVNGIKAQQLTKAQKPKAQPQRTGII